VVERWATGLRGPPVKDEQAAGVAGLGRCLGDRRGRQVVVEVVDPQSGLGRIGHGKRLAGSTTPGRMARPGVIGMVRRQMYCWMNTWAKKIRYARNTIHMSQWTSLNFRATIWRKTHVTMPAPIPM